MTGKGGRGRKNGFTLIELMVVLLLIAIMTAVLLPEMKGTFEDALLRSTTRNLAAACQLAYSQSVSSRHIHQVRVDTQEHKFFVEQAEGEGYAPERFVPLQGFPGAQGSLDPRISFEFRPPENQPQIDEDAPPPPQTPFLSSGIADPGEPGTIRFYPDGTAKGPVIVLTDRAGYRLALQIHPVTARARIRALDPLPSP